MPKNIEFHAVFHRATSTKRLGNILVALENAGGVFVAQARRLVPEMRERAINDHYGILEACESRDVDRAYEIQYDHVYLLSSSGGADEAITGADHVAAAT